MEKCSIIKGTMKEKPRLLIVDDELDQSKLIQNCFLRKDFQVFTAETGELAVASIKKHKPDLILLDLKLPGSVKGKDVLRSLREYDKKTKVIIITGDLLPPAEVKELTELGLAELVSKPVDLEDLEKIVRRALEESYPNAVRFEKVVPKKEAPVASLRRIVHDLANIASDISSKCELYILNEEEGLNKNRSERERLDETVNILKSVLNQSERLTDIVKKLSSFAKKEI